jgi:hypothetical protein
VNLGLPSENLGGLSMMNLYHNISSQEPERSRYGSTESARFVLDNNHRARNERKQSPGKSRESKAEAITQWAQEGPQISTAQPIPP